MGPLKRIDPSDLGPPSWELYVALANQTARNPARLRALTWAIERLADLLGDDWLRRGAAAARPPGLLSALTYAGTHTEALGVALEWAVQLELARDTRGIAKVRSDLRGNAEAGREAHTAALLRLATSARRLGWESQLEPARGAGAPPADILIHSPTGPLLIEAKVRSQADATRATTRASADLFELVRDLEWEIDGWIFGRFGRWPTDQELRAIRDWAVNWRSDPTTAPATWSADSITLQVAERDAARGSLSGPPLKLDSWSRLITPLVSKTERMRDSGAGWLYLEARTAMWGMSAWATQSARRKMRSLQAVLEDTLPYDKPAGIVLASGATHYPGTVTERLTRGKGSTLVRRTVEPGRARETIIVPYTDDASREARHFEQLAITETGCLDWALAELDLPSLELMIGG